MISFSWFSYANESLFCIMLGQSGIISWQTLSFPLYCRASKKYSMWLGEFMFMQLKLTPLSQLTKHYISILNSKFLYLVSQLIDIALLNCEYKDLLAYSVFVRMLQNVMHKHCPHFSWYFLVLGTCQSTYSESKVANSQSEITVVFFFFFKGKRSASTIKRMYVCLEWMNESEYTVLIASIMVVKKFLLRYGRGLEIYRFGF